MKFKKLLVLSMLSLLGTSAWAEVPEGSWTMPEPQGLEFTTFTDDGTHYYLYSPAAKMFFSSGNSWNTQASVRTFGYPFWLTSSSEGDAPDGSYELWNYVENPDRTDVTGDHNLFTDDGGSTWVDHASQGNYSWSFTIVGDFVRFQNVALIADKPEYEGKYIGWTGKYDGDKNSSVLKMIAPDTEGASVDWKAVTEESYLAFKENEEAYKAYTDGVDCFFAAQKLRSALVEAEGLKANIAEGLAAFTNLSSTPDELNAAIDALKPIIEARKALKKALDDAATAGFTDVAAYQAVFDNGDATKAELEKATADLGNAVVEWGKTNASVDHPVDMTSKINNPNFDNASYTGWTSDGDNPNMVGSGSHGPANVAEHWNHAFNTYQTISNLPAGVYALGAKTAWRCNWSEMEAHLGPGASLYATVGENEFATPFNYMWGCYNTESLGGTTDFGTSAGENSESHENAEGETVTYYSPNDPSAFRVYCEKGFYDTKLMFGVSEGDVRIGVKLPSKLGSSDNWSCFDTFTLTYYGSGADAAQLYVNECLKNFQELTIPEGTIFTESYLTAYEQNFEGDHTANSFAEAVAIIDGINESKKAIDKNIELWQELQDLVETIRAKYLLDEEFAGIEPEIDYLADYCEFDGPLAEENYTLTNEELEAELTKVNEWINSLIEKSKQDVYDGKNMTQYITNPTFETSTTKNTGTSDGWTIDRISGGNVTPGPIGGDGDTFLNKCGYYNGCFESWHCYNWDVWQEVKGLPVGMYELEVQGYVRCEVSGYVKGDPLVEPYTSPVYLYMNNATSSFPSVYSQVPAEAGVEFQIVEDWTQEEVNGNYFPNSMGGAAQCFHIDKEAGLNGMYKVTAYGLIAKEGDTFRIGVKMNKNEYWWCIWDNFKLTYRKPTVDMVKPELEKAVAQIDLTQPMGKSVYAKAQEVIAAANAAKESNDAQAMFDALADLYEVAGEITASTDKFTALQNVVKELEDNAFISDSPAKNEALALVDEINGGIASYSYEDAEVEGLQEQIYAMYTKLNMPTDMASASDENPIECTAVMKSPSFEDADMLNSSTGWTNPGNLGNDDTQKAALAMEFWQNAFDMYQTIYGLPKGTYRLTVDAWCRNGGNADNYKEWVDDNKATMAYAYAVDGDSTVYAAPVANLMAGAITDEDPGIDGVALATDITEGSYYLPNSLIGGWSYIQYQSEPVYKNEVICKVGDDGKLTVGMKKAEYRGNSWVVLDNFQLFYLGTNSSATPSDGTAINTLENGVAAVKVEFFNLNGARINKPGKGVALMKQTLRDGSVKLQKVIIK